MLLTDLFMSRKTISNFRRKIDHLEEISNDYTENIELQILYYNLLKNKLTLGMVDPPE